jgi:L-rhamnose-H+ transport protein
MPTIGGLLTTPDLFNILRNSPSNSKLWAYLFGVLWGFGGLGAGLGLRYLGLSLGQSISLGVCAIVGTLVPAAMDNKLHLLIETFPGMVIILGFLICIAGIASCGYAGVLKDRTLTEEEKKESVKEFSAVKGTIYAVLGGIMSAFMAIAINAGHAISEQAIKAGTTSIFVNNPSYVFILGGGFTTNFIYILIFVSRKGPLTMIDVKPKEILFRNMLMAVLSGMMWYGQFFFYGMGTTKMGKFDFASWTIHMASIIMFSNLWGLWLKEWKLVDKRTFRWLIVGILLLMISVFLIGIGNYMAGIA